MDDGTVEDWVALPVKDLFNSLYTLDVLVVVVGGRGAG